MYTVKRKLAEGNVGDSRCAADRYEREMAGIVLSVDRPLRPLETVGWRASSSLGCRNPCRRQARDGVRAKEQLGGSSGTYCPLVASRDLGGGLSESLVSWFLGCWGGLPWSTSGIGREKRHNATAKKLGETGSDWVWEAWWLLF